MGIGTQRKEIDRVLDIYRERLDTIPDELFTVTPPGGGWSYAEVYSHILQATIGSSVAAEKCTLKSCVPTSQGRSLVGMFVLSFGAFPPAKVKMPEKLAARMPVSKLSKEDARNLLIKCRKRIDDVAPLIHDASKHCRVKHPRMGMLNARQWFKFILIHAKHHLKQLDRIQKKFHTP
jgi:hypothetical protein